MQLLCREGFVGTSSSLPPHKTVLHFCLSHM
jgi:hypothetical protein